MDVTYFTGYNNGHDYSSGHGSPSNSMNDANYSHAFAKEELVSPSTLSPTLHYRHDSILSPSISSLSHLAAQQHQAELQPCAAAAQLTPHAINLHPHRSYAMSRGPSQISNHSSTSSSQQHSSYQPYAPQGSSHRNGLGMGSVPMLRSASDRPAFHAQPTNSLHPGSLPHHLSTRSFVSHSANTSPTGIQETPQYSSQGVYVDNSVGRLDWSSLAGLGAFENNTGNFGHTAVEQYYDSSMTLAPPSRPRPRALSDSLTFAPAPVARQNISISAQTESLSTNSRDPSPLPKKRRRHQTSALDSEPEVITGHVLASGKFKCSNAECSDLKFGRQADFRRHFVNVHESKKIEYFCTWKGCDRSKRPAKKGKGRSFGSRRDKMEEHVRTVHEKVDKRKRHASSTEDEEDDDETEEAEQPQSKTQRRL